jgi:hypothetical protein
MSSKPCPVRIDLSQDLPPRARPLAAETVARVFGGCTGEWQLCNNNWDCCSNKCLYREWISSERRYIWKCLPTWATVS